MSMRTRLRLRLRSWAGLLALCAALGLAVGPALAAEAKLAKADQESLALEIFKKLRATPNDQLDTFRRLYYQVIEQCPDTERAEISHWRLSNLLLMGYDPPRVKEAVTLLEGFLARYPQSRGAPQVQNRLARYYEEGKQWCKARDMYQALVPTLPPDSQRTHGYWFAFAKALEQCGQKDQAVIWYQKVAESQQGKDTMLAEWAKEALRRLGK